MALGNQNLKFSFHSVNRRMDPNRKNSHLLSEILPLAYILKFSIYFLYVGFCFKHGLLVLFHGHYFCRVSLSPFLVAVSKFAQASSVSLSVGMRFKMKFETEDTSDRRWKKKLLHFFVNFIHSFVTNYAHLSLFKIDILLIPSHLFEFILRVFTLLWIQIKDLKSTPFCQSLHSFELM